MESEGQKSGSNPAAMLASLMGKREKLWEELRNIEKQVFELETSYLQESGHFGHVLKGFEGFLSSSKSTTNLKRSRKFQPEDRLFSLSSVTSPTAEELGLVRDDGRSDLGPGRSKAGNAPANGQGKPKKGRTSTGARDVKKIRASSEAEFEEEDDLDMR
ncbi:chromatin modification-related protein MEAF6 isoform X1 [Ricinus communis]|uniref:chromatin modification-related protein MEAF6 isoform X1 n=1 Tax=Ricinus communis TaxID=3988 RepID=UPI00201AEA68|nr:chromatin modification-related protein MEAF6 isoform X1 [Ricinus communis]